MFHRERGEQIFCASCQPGPDIRLANDIKNQLSRLSREREVRGLELPALPDDLTRDVAVAASWARDAYPRENIFVKISPFWPKSSDIVDSVATQSSRLRALLPSSLQKSFDETLAFFPFDKEARSAGRTADFLVDNSHMAVIKPIVQVDHQGEVKMVLYDLPRVLIEPSKEVWARLIVEQERMRIKTKHQGVLHEQDYYSESLSHRGILQLVKDKLQVLNAIWPSQDLLEKEGLRLRMPRTGTGSLTISACSPSSGRAEAIIDVKVEKGREKGPVFTFSTP